MHELRIEKHIDVAPARLWGALTARLDQWFAPRPWTTEIRKVEWRAGGRFDVTLKGPDGERHENEGLFLEVTPARRLAWTDAVTAGLEPRGPFAVCIIELWPEGEGTRYVGIARHWTEEAMEQHRAMGFEQGWNAAADQLAEIAR